ncbi:MAG: YhjD/YihY/BrkB family envelope integrity protein, partial [Candidatus Limnocylindria bacterium]
YRTLPQDDVSWLHAGIGAVVATIGVRLAQAVMGFMSDAGTFQTPYGDLAGVALMATWALVVGVVVLFGACVVAVLSGRLEELDGMEAQGSRPFDA